jgi:hypothetical protein
LAELRPDEFGPRQIAFADLSNAEADPKGRVIAKLGSIQSLGPGPISIQIRGRIARERDPS